MRHIENLGFILSKDKLKRIKSDLDGFRNDYPFLFKEIFQESKAIKYNGNYLNELWKLGIVSKINTHWSSDYLIYSFGHLYFLTDNFLLPETDRVFPLSQDESLFLATKITVNKNSSILDIGTGSGIYAIIAATQGATVTAFDINEKALNYARFNALLNDVSDRIHFLQSDMFAKLNLDKYSLLISNPAIIPTVEGSKFYIHSDGGVDGTRMSSEILKNFSDRLSEGGQLHMLATSFSTNHGKMTIENFIEQHYSHKKIKFTIEELYTPCLTQLSLLTDHFNSSGKHRAMLRHFEEQNFKALHYLYIIAEPGLPFGILNAKKRVDFPIAPYTGSWNARLARLFRVYQNNTVRQNKQPVIH